MSGVGSTNAMKKGSGNNPFLAHSESDMQNYLNSAYTGSIVKYTGPSTKTAVSQGNNLNLGDAQNLVVDLTKSFTSNQWSSKSRKWYITIDTETGNKCIMDITINKQTGVIGTPVLISDTIKALIYSIYTPYSSLIGRNINDLDVKFLSVTGTDVDRDVVTNWPTTSGWQKDCFNDSGKITLWSYGEKVTAIQNQNDMDYWSAYPILYTEPYVANVLYKVVYGNGQYYFEEFYHISENVTTATVEDAAPGKTFYDFTGTKQTGTGTKINPYLATDLDTFRSFPVASFIKWLGPDRTVLDETTGQMLIQGEVYRAVEDGDILQYVILPTLTNEATAEDVAAGKEFINGNGQKVVGTKTATPVYGVSGLYQSDPVLTRTDDAVGMSWTMNDNIISSDFDNVFPYNQMVRETIDGDVFVKIPAMYLRIGRNSDGYITDLAVSEDKMIVDENQVVAHVDAFYYGAYGASVSDGKMYSKTGVARQYSTTRANFRTYAKARGEKCRQLDLAHMRVLDFLWLIEFATKNSESVMWGYAGYGQSCGATDSLTVPSGQFASQGRMRWRYIEDFVGNGAEFFDGLTGYAATDDVSKYNDNSTGDLTFPRVNGDCLSALKIDASKPLLAVPGATVENLNYNTFFCDFARLDGTAVYLRGRHNTTTERGLFFTNGYNASYTNKALGSRLLLIP